MCWMSSNSSMRSSCRARLARPLLLHLVEQGGHGAFPLQGLFDLVGCDIRVFAVLQEARALVSADELDEGWRIRFPVGREPFEVLEYGVDASLCEELDSVFGVFVEIRIENSLVHKIRVFADVEEHPAQIMQLQRRKDIGGARNSVLDLLSVGADRL